MINAKLQSIIDTKSAIGNAIVNKGGTITGETPFFNYAAQIDGISTGTPQTIFAASDGSKWARTNAVNLTNVSNNVTSDFNWWQPANNSTSDPILNVGTVGANISGNIGLVQVNQVNISQYVNLVATDTLGGKYVGYNGYDSITNPTPTGNTTFNRWLLNNSATGTVLFANSTFTTGIYNGVNAIANQANMPFVNNTATYGGELRGLIINNGFIYVAGDHVNSSNRTIRKFHEDNLVFVANSATFGGNIRSFSINNGFIYAGGFTNQTIQKFHESNLAFVGNTNSYGGNVLVVSVNNGFIYAGGELGGFVNGNVKKYHESNLVFVGNTANYGGYITEIAANNNFLYVGGGTASVRVQVYREDNLATNINSPIYSTGLIESIKINNNFVYVGGYGNGFGAASISQYHQSNLVFVANSPSFGGPIRRLAINNNFIYAGGESNQTVKKFHTSNLGFVGNTPSYGATIQVVTTNNSFIYAGGSGNQTINKYRELTFTTFDNQTFYTATKIKE